MSPEGSRGFLRDPSGWPIGPHGRGVCCLKRIKRDATGFPTFARLRADRLSPIEVLDDTDKVIVSYETVDALVDAGWLVD